MNLGLSLGFGAAFTAVKNLFWSNGTQIKWADNTQIEWSK